MSDRVPALRVLLGATLLVLLGACGQAPLTPPAPAPSPSPAPAAAPAPRESATPAPKVAGNPATPATWDKIKFKEGSGETLYSLKRKDDGAKLVNAREEELARFNLSGDKLKIKDPADNVLGYVSGKGDRFKVTDPTQEKTLFEMQRQPDGDWKLEDGAEKLIYKLKKRDYGFEVEDDAEHSLYKVKARDGKTSLRNAEDKTVAYTNDPIRPESVTCLAFDAIESLPIRAGLMFRVLEAGTP